MQGKPCKNLSFLVLPKLTKHRKVSILSAINVAQVFFMMMSTSFTWNIFTHFQETRTVIENNDYGKMCYPSILRGINETNFTSQILFKNINQYLCLSKNTGFPTMKQVRNLQKIFQTTASFQLHLICSHTLRTKCSKAVQCGMEQQ